MVDATTVAQWEYVTGNVLAASDAMLSTQEGRDLVKYLVAAFERTRYDYTYSAADTKNNEGNWAATTTSGQGLYNKVVAEFAYLQENFEADPSSDQLSATYKAVEKFQYLSVADQLDKEEIDLPKMAQESAYFFYEQKVLAENPNLDPASQYEENFYKDALEDVKDDGLSVLPRASSTDWTPASTDWTTTDAPIQKENPGDAKCSLSTTVNTLPHTFADGSTGTYAYAADADCEWKFTASNYVNVEITKLMSETPDDGLEVYDTQSGDLLAAFTGRWDASELPEIRSSEVTVKWTTNSYDENAVGEPEDVGFQATASSEGSAPGTCNPGESGASCEYDYCLGVVTETGSGTIRATTEAKYKPNSRCGWRITPTMGMDYLELKFTEFAIENGFDFVKIYEGNTAPTGFSLTDPATEPKLLYAATGSTLPPKLTFQGSVFVTFESDGLGNTAVGAAGNGGFEIEYRSISQASDIKTNCDDDWTSPIKNCALDYCTGTQERSGAHVHGSFSSSSGQSAAAATDYPAMTT